MEKIKVMLKNRYLTAGSSIVLLTIIAGCAATESPQLATPSPVAESSPPPIKPSAPLPVSAKSSETATNTKIQQYLNALTAQGFAKEDQGIWIQSGNTLLANYQGTVPLSAASITKVATSLVALQQFGPEHQFITLISTNGTIKNGVLKGDLVIEGSQDPLFVWEEAIALGNALNQKGIKRVTGSLIIVDKFYMNFELNPLQSGELLKQALNSQIWPSEAAAQYQTLPPNTPKPQIVIDGAVKVLPARPRAVPLVKHYSLPLAELIKKMNQYSNNLMADMLADTVGGAKTVAQKAAAATGVPPAEIQLVNGSGLSEDNRISPRAICALFMALERYLQPYSMTVADVLTVVGKDKGILSERPLPKLAVIKSGTLDNVSALGGALPTQKKQTVWFAIVNRGENVEVFRTQQELLLKSFLKDWGAVQASPPELTPNPARSRKVSRNEIVP
ncbi:D-alanyl-D-alanine carboxypeptidase [Microcoleus sp. bin38.metabat.b11b12b14.051]|uniref:D-alanyl-D-alanine carboxypeptidase n=1 Tax=Microcoleus sp. bin38.metabat.b11b12b14.051 TaxID=2742709 RepID=UPI0025F061BD|nr:D-alanyl-D-alanine carboxypeptidase [Microcoleus sp. bin38.metabat.b11b12b14.051]